jgi:hypothetical protein
MSSSWQALTEAIAAAGREARAASMDAHGYLVPATEAYDFIRIMWIESEDPRAELLPCWMPNGFAQAYRSER